MGQTRQHLVERALRKRRPRAGQAQPRIGLGHLGRQGSGPGLEGRELSAVDKVQPVSGDQLGGLGVIAGGDRVGDRFGYQPLPQMPRIGPAVQRRDIIGQDLAELVGQQVAEQWW